MVTNLKNYYIKQDNKITCGTCIPAIATVLNYISTIFSKFGISNSSTINDDKINNLIECLIKFRHIVRNKVLEHDVKDKALLIACDKIRSELSTYGVTIKVLYSIYNF